MTQTIPVEKPFNTALFIGLGIAFWIAGVLLIRFVGAPLFDHSHPWLLLLFFSSIPFYWVVVKMIAVVGQVSGASLLQAFSLSSVAAAVLDGIALTWFPSLYGLEQAGLLLAGAWLIYAFGVGLGIAYWVSR